MTEREFTVLVKGLKAVYPDPKFLPDNYAIEVWYGFLGHLDYDTARVAINKHIVTSEYPPTIKDILGATQEESTISEAEAWTMVRKGIRNGNYGSEEEFTKLPEIVQKAVGSPQSLSAWAQLPTSEVETVIQSQFLRSFRATVARAKTDAVTALIGVRNVGRIEG